MPNPRSAAQIAGHPIHPMLMPFAIAFLVATLILPALVLGILVITGCLAGFIYSMASRIRLEQRPHPPRPQTAAKLLIDQHGPEAGDFAAGRPDVLLVQGDMDGEGGLNVHSALLNIIVHD